MPKIVHPKIKKSLDAKKHRKSQKVRLKGLKH